MFEIPEWESNIKVKKKHQKSITNIQSGYIKKKKKQKETKTDKVLKKEIISSLTTKTQKSNKSRYKPKKTNTKQQSESKTTQKKHGPFNENKNVNKNRKQLQHQTDTIVKVPSRKKSLTHQTMFIKSDKRIKHIQENVVTKPAYDFNPGKSKKEMSLRERMLQKLKAARFRYLNEQMYTNVGKDAKKYFDTDPTAYAAYHEGYQQQVTKWPLNPIDVIIRKIKKFPKNFIIADFGCGEAKLAKSIEHTVHCFDLVAVDERVTACDMAHVPLKDNSVNVVVFCLSLMGTNLKDYILEARRVLKNKGLLLIAEVESRFENVDDFIKNLRSYGFINTVKDFSHNLFFFLDFTKQNSKAQNSLPNISLKPCLYKKR